MNTVPNPPMERRAAALAEVQQMHADMDALHAELEAIQRDLNRSEDRVTLLSEERTRWRHDAQIYRTKLVELATVQSNIGLLVVRADEIMKSVNELLATATPASEEEEKSRLHSIVDALEGEQQNGATNPHSHDGA